MGASDQANLALKMFCPTNEAIADDKGIPGAYVRRPKKTLAQLMGHVEAAMKATRAYSAGEYISVGGTLYKATTSIASDATLTAGTNVSAIAGGSTIHPAFMISNSEKDTLCFGKFSR